MSFKPMKAVDFDPKYAKYPCFAFPKIDGVRALNVDGKLIGRSGKQFKNKFNTEYFSRDCFIGLDGEMVADHITANLLVNKTTSALNTIEGTIPTTWYVFDFMEYPNRPYRDRLTALRFKLAHVQDLRIVYLEPKIIENEQQLLDFEETQLDLGFEGIIIRDMDAPYKFGRSTAREGYYSRLKRFVDSEFLITEVRQGQTNNNELQKDAFGYAERATMAENMEPNGQVGTLIGTTLEDIVVRGKVVIAKNERIEVSPGKLTQEERKYYWQNQDQIIGKIGKYQFFPIGIKDKPRFPTFQSFRMLEDL